jgi:hypothetical protein
MQNIIFDTQVISHAFRGQGLSMCGGSVASVTASEFLNMYTGKATQARYYLPLGTHPCEHLHRERDVGNKTGQARQKFFTDRIVLTFGSDFPSLVEFGSLAVSRAVNDRDARCIALATEFLPKDERQQIRKRFNFLVESDIRVIPLNARIVETASLLLCRFVRSHHVKQNFRNTWNDLVIFATASTLSTGVYTLDKELNRFIAEIGDAPVSITNGLLRTSCASAKQKKSRRSMESRFYLNRGWRNAWHPHYY